MSRILKTSTAAQIDRNNGRVKSTTKQRRSMITLDEMRRLPVATRGGQRKTLLAMPDQEFRDWFYAFIESIVPHIKPKDGVKAIIEQAKNDALDLTLNKEARFRLVNDVFGTAAFRRSGIEIFASEEATA